MTVRTKLVVAGVLAALLLLPGTLGAKGDPQGEQLLKAGEKLAQDFKFIEADNKYKEALKAFEAAGDRAGVALATEKLGKLSQDVGNYTGALEAFREAHKLYQDVKQPSAAARILGDLGQTYDDWGDFPGAIHYYKQAIKGGLPPLDKVKIELSLGDVYLRLGDDEESARHLRAALQAAQGAKAEKGMGPIIIAIGEAFQKAGRLDEAKTAYQEASQVTGEGAVKREALYHLGDVAFAQKDTAQAANYYRQAKYSLGLGRLALEEKKYDAALQEFNKALTEADRQKTPQMIFGVEAGIGLSYLRKNEYPQAENHLRQAVKALEEVRDLLPEGKRTYFLSGSTQGFKHLATYEALIMTLVMQGKKDEAFKMAEYTRSRVLTEALSGKEAVAQEV
ncbi:MAG: tetratricopeptide repeat protein, partial [Deltaproteobacteria bacterium]|nr:tetratricopeptide repeat protein [Deltaproteobacteria bacterium]